MHFEIDVRVGWGVQQHMYVWLSGRGSRNWCGNICCTLLASALMPSPPTLTSPRSPLLCQFPLEGTRVVCATCAVYWKTCLIYGAKCSKRRATGTSRSGLPSCTCSLTFLSNRRVDWQAIKLCKERAVKSRKQQFRENELPVNAIELKVRRNNLIGGNLPALNWNCDWNWMQNELPKWFALPWGRSISTGDPFNKKFLQHRRGGRVMAIGQGEIKQMCEQQDSRERLMAQ